MKTEKKEIIIDAKDRALGRTATEAALHLRGKTSTDYAPNLAPKIKVKVINISKAKVNAEKIEKTFYKRHSGYPGSLKYTSLKKVWEKNPKTAFIKIIRGMLPKNKLRKEILKNLIIEL